MERKNFQRHVADQMEYKALNEKTRDKTFFYFKDEEITYKQFYERSLLYAHWFNRLKKASKSEDPEVRAAVFMDNHPSFLYSYGGCALTGGLLFGVNAGLRGQVLADLLNQARCPFIIADDRHFDRIYDIRDKLKYITEDRTFVVNTGMEGFSLQGDARWVEEVVSELSEELGDEALVRPEAQVTLQTPLMIIYTSGTTGLPKGIRNSHGKLMNLGTASGGLLQLKPTDIGYACMPLFHSNSMFLGVMSAFVYGASVVIRDRFSASGFTPDILKYGVTYWNYVGQPVHYVILSLEKQYGSEEAIIEAVAKNPANKLRLAYGNGASPIDQEKFMKYFNLDDMMEAYGTTEMAIAVVRFKGDPRGSVGAIVDPAVKIFNENGEECPPAIYDEQGRFVNYKEAVGEIVRVGGPMPSFEGYHELPNEEAKKIRDGVYHSGDLGHVRIINGRRYLYFDGRTDDWIRKDGENFSAENVAQVVASFPGVESACAYGVPCPISDEWVMSAVRMDEGKEFDPKAFFDYCEAQCIKGDMDRKWFPDFVRVVKEFEHTRTQKILVKPLKQEFYNLEWVPEGTIFFRRRGFDTYKPFTKADFEELKEEFKKNGREQLLEAWR